MSKTTILYKDIAPGAEDDASVSTNGAASFCAISKLPHGATATAITSGERNYWGLDGSFTPLENQGIAYWSTTMSGADGVFDSKPVITITFDRQHSSLGVTLVADTATGGYCNSVNIKWYQGTTLKADVNFAPNSATYYCMQRVTSYDKIVITLNSTNLPYRYAKLEHLIFGVYRTFDMTELRRASIVNQMSGISEELPISTMSWTLDSREDVDYMFQLKQPVEVRNSGSLIGVYYIDSFSRSAKNIYDIDCYDAFGVLDETPFSGGVYSGKSANDKQNVIEVTGATLVSTSIGQAVAQRVYHYYLRRNTCKAKIVWAGEQLGDRLTIHNSWDGTETGNLLKMEIALSNTVAGNFETLGV